MVEQRLLPRRRAAAGAQRMRQLIGRDRRGAELADDDAGGGIGDRASPPASGWPAACARASAAMTVSPAPETSKTSRASAGTLFSAARGPDQGHALLGAGAEQGGQAGGGHDLVRAAAATSASVPTASRAARPSSRRIGRQAVGAAIVGEVVGSSGRRGPAMPQALRRGDGGSRPPPGVEHALGIVRQDQRGAARQRRLDRGDERGLLGGVGRGGDLVVQPHHLLGAGDDPHLADGRAAGARRPWHRRCAGRRRAGRGTRPPPRRARPARPAPPGRRAPRGCGRRCRRRPAWRSVRPSRTTGTGASGEIRSTAP